MGVHEGKGKTYDKREKGKAGAVKGKRERPKTGNLIRDPTRHPDRAHARTTRNDFPVRGGLPKGELTPPNLRYIQRLQAIAMKKDKRKNTKWKKKQKKTT